MLGTIPYRHNEDKDNFATRKKICPHQKGEMRQRGTAMFSIDFVVIEAYFCFPCTVEYGIIKMIFCGTRN